MSLVNSVVNLDVYRSNVGSTQGARPVLAYKADNYDANGGSVATMPTPVDKQALSTAVTNLNQYISSAVSSIEFAVDEDSGKTLVKVVDAETRKVLRQIPNEEVLALSKTLDRMAGMIIKQKV